VRSNTHGSWCQNTLFAAISTQQLLIMSFRTCDPSSVTDPVLPPATQIHVHSLARPQPAFARCSYSRSIESWESKSPLCDASDYATSTSKLPLRPDTTSSSRRHWIRKSLHAGKRAVYSRLHPKTILDMVDIREVFWPFTWKKYVALLLVAAFVVGITISNSYYHWINKAMQITRRNMLPVLIIVIGLEPIMITTILLVARVPPLSDPPCLSLDVEIEKVITTQKTSKDHRTALVIPCHNSDHEALAKVLRSALLHFRPKDIFIVDNGRSRHPCSSVFRQFVRSQSPEINYMWSPIGSKNAAQLVGALAARSYEFIMTVDDDVSIPSTFRAPIDKLNDEVKACAFPLKATDANGDIPLLLVAWQDCEYKMSGLTKLAESAICGVLYPHGAGWFCERDTLIDLISNYHSIDFIAEDVNTGLSMQKMKKRIAFDATCVLETEVPTSVLGGPGLNWWNQRYRSWEMGRHGRLLAFAGRLLFSLNGQKTLWGIFAQKFIHLYSIATIVVDWVRVPVFVTMGTSPRFWVVGCSLMLAATLPTLVYKYVNARRRPDLQPRFWAIVTYPIYKQLYAFVSVFGAIRAVIFYVGGHRYVFPSTLQLPVGKNVTEEC
jgi:cellulose synthase/poly-beta-1,6-N-acetylglucosamine synthase-like glycosyltransferase